jgi:hypothetical protein
MHAMNDHASELNYRWSVIMDEQSTVNGTVLLAGYADENDEVKTTRVEFKIANTDLGALSVGHLRFDDE